MKINSISNNIIFQGKKTISMRGKRKDDAAIRKFENFMVDNNFMLLAEIVPVKKNDKPVVKATLATIEFYKNPDPNPIPLIKRGPVAPISRVECIGDSIQEAELRLIKNYEGTKLSIIGNPNYVVNVPIFRK